MPATARRVERLDATRRAVRGDAPSTLPAWSPSRQTCVKDGADRSAYDRGAPPGRRGRAASTSWDVPVRAWSAGTPPGSPATRRLERPMIGRLWNRYACTGRVLHVAGRIRVGLTTGAYSWPCISPDASKNRCAISTRTTTRQARGSRRDTPRSRSRSRAEVPVAGSMLGCQHRTMAAARDRVGGGLRRFSVITATRCHRRPGPRRGSTRSAGRSVVGHGPPTTPRASLASTCPAPPYPQVINVPGIRDGNESQACHRPARGCSG